MQRYSHALRSRLRENFRWRTDPDQDASYADDSGWLRHPGIVQEVGPCLSQLHPNAGITAVMGVESRGAALACLVAQALEVGVIEVRKSPERASHDDVWLTQTTGPDYLDRHLDLAVRRSIISSADHVLFVDDWIATGGQAVACHQLVAKAGRPGWAPVSSLIPYRTTECAET